MHSNNSKILNLKLNTFTVPVGRLSTVLRCSLHPASDDWSVSLDPPGKGVRCEPPQQTRTTWSWTRCTVHCSFSRPRSVSAGTAERPRPFKALRISSGLVDAFHVCHWVLRLEKANYWLIWWNGFSHGACEYLVSPSDVMSNYDNMTRKPPSNCTDLRVSTPVRILWTNAIMSKMKPAGMAIKGPWNRHGAPIDEVNENPWCYRSLSKSSKMREKSGYVWPANKAAHTCTLVQSEVDAPAAFGPRPKFKHRSPEGAIGKKTTEGGQTKAFPPKKA